MEYVFSPVENMFYPLVLKESYISSGSWPGDGIHVSEDVFREFTGPRPEGRVRGVGSGGMPEWIDAPTSAEPEIATD